MNIEFTDEEIKDAARTARIYCPGFSEEMFESLLDLQKRLKESGYLEAVRGIIRLQQEKGISCSEALDACYELAERKVKLEHQIAKVKKEADDLGAMVKQTIEELKQQNRTLLAARKELAQTRAGHAAAVKELEVFRRKAEKEKELLEKEVEDCRRQANIDKEETIAAGQVKAEVESCGFSLETALGLAKEFAGHENAREQLTEGLKQHGTLTRSLHDLAAREKKEKASLAEELSALERQNTSLLYQLKAGSDTLSQLTRNIVDEQNLRAFYSRYAGLSFLIDRLVSWNQVYFVRCNNPVYSLAGALDARHGNAHIWTDKPLAVCPQCGDRYFVPDVEIYQPLNWEPGAPLALTLGGQHASR